MRIGSLLSIFLFVLGSCNSQKKAVGNNVKTKDIEIQYEANTRGFYQKLVLKNATISSTKDRNGIENPNVQKVSEVDWNLIMQEINKVDFENLPNLKAPTEKRFYDGAAIANLKIIYKGKTYQTSDFDHGFPPMEIKRVVEIVNLLFKLEE
jgi:hypothetical protein